MMKLVVGLGNPGAKYAAHRHNIGFMCLDAIVAAHGFGPWKSKFQGAVVEGRFGSDRVVLLKPETFMNNSGQSVSACAQFYKIPPQDIMVFHDELDLAPGKVRVKQGGGHAGHNGLRSIHAHIGANYGRVRLGIGHPGHKDRVAGYVLANFAKSEQDWLDDVLRGVSDGAADLAAGDNAKFMNAVALRVAPPRSGTGMGQNPGRDKASNSADKKKAQKPNTDRAPKAAPASETPPEQEARSPLQRLVDRFK